MANSFEAGRSGGAASQARAGAPEKARFPSDPVFGKTGTEAGAGLGEAARSATSALRRQAAQFADDVSHELGKTGESQKARGVDALRRVAEAIDGAADDLRDQSPIAARAVREAARQVDGLSDALANRDLNDLVDQAVRLARAQPLLFVGGSIAAGFVLARFLMSGAGPRRPTET